MEENKKKPYERPMLTKVKLDPQCAVLGFCKNQNTYGPRSGACGSFFRCSAMGS